MKKILPGFCYAFFALVVILCTSCEPKKPAERKQYGPATGELKNIMENNPAYKAMLEESIEKAKSINPDPATNPAQSLEEYYDFISYCEKAMPWTFLKKNENKDIHENAFQSLASFYFVIDQPLPELEGKGYYNNSLQYAEPFASWLITFTKNYGKYLDTEDSWNETYYQLVLNDPSYNLQKGWYENPSNWKTFNQFFTRYLSSPDVRPIASPDDNSVVVSFADSRPMGVWKIDSTSHIISQEGVEIKTANVTSITDLIGEDSEYKDAFANGTFMHSFLGSNDYHRYHFPLDGTIKEVRLIQGSNPGGGKLWWDAEQKRYGYDPSLLGWQMLETRGCLILDAGEFGLVALLPVGMVTVGSVNFEENINPGTVVKKGDMMGHFAYGGSDFIMIFQNKVNFTMTAPKMEGKESYNHILMGEKLGKLTIDN